MVMSPSFGYSRNTNAVMEIPHRLYSATSHRDEKDSKTTSSTDIAKPSMQEKFKKLWKNYGMIAVGTYLTMYVTTLGSLFLAVDYDILNAASVGLDPIVAIDKFCGVVELFTGNHSFPEYVREHPHVGKFGIAWVMCKFTEPLRLGITIAVVPQVAKLLGRHKAEHDHDHPQSPQQHDEKKNSPTV